jgi:glutamyl endopeptidase
MKTRKMVALAAALAALAALAAVVVLAPAGTAPAGGAEPEVSSLPPATLIGSDGDVVTTAESAAISAGTPDVWPSNPGAGATAGDTAVTVETGTQEPGVASAPAGRSVLGADGRTQVDPTTGNPSRFIGQIVIGGSICTGWLVDADTVITAGHCVSNGAGTFFDVNTMTFIPGRNGGTEPYGSCGVDASYTTNGFHVGASKLYDYGAIILDCTIGTTTGWMGYFKVGGITGLQGLTAHVRGYPGDKPLGTQWTMRGTVAASQKRFVYYAIDTFGGQSGSPVYQFRSGCGACAMAIHAYGNGGSGPAANNNGGPRINIEVFNNLNAFRAL